VRCAVMPPRQTGAVCVVRMRALVTNGVSL
jgi:hypothetical protein